MIESFNHFGAIANELDNVVGQIVRKTSFDWLANAKAQIRANHQIDTGFMWGSGYVVTSEDSTYSQVARPIKKGQKMFEPVEKPPDKHTAYMAFAAWYAWIQNYGSVYQPARPFIEPSREITRQSMDEALSRVEEKLRQAQ